MHLLDLTLPTAAENLALDEALLDMAEESASPLEVLRLWEPADAAVIVGRSSRVAEEVDLEACRARRIPVLRRTSGGAAVVTGPGCLMYAVVLRFDLRPELRAVDQAHCLVIRTLAEALRTIRPEAASRGTCDLAVGERKFSGNSLRMKRRGLLYHGTVLYDFPLDLIASCLTIPPRMPDYRARRGHRDFVTNVTGDPAVIRQAVVDAWSAHTPLADWPREATETLVRTRYGQESWNLSR